MNTKKIDDLKYFHQDWWFDESVEDSFSYFDLDSLYDKNYFTEDHLSGDITSEIVKLSKTFFKEITKKDLNSVIELGCAAGWLTEKLHKSNLEVFGVEGSIVGYEKCINRGLSNIVMRHDLRLPLNLNKKFDLCFCTEVAEHIEPPFSSVLVSNIINHSDVVWFSFNSTDGHHHHSNCQPMKFWVNLFEFFNYGFLATNRRYKESLSHRLDCIFYNKSTFGNLNINSIIDL